MYLPILLFSEHLRKAYKDFMLLRAHHRAKDVLYLMVRFFFFQKWILFLRNDVCIFLI